MSSRTAYVILVPLLILGCAWWVPEGWSNRLCPRGVTEIYRAQWERACAARVKGETTDAEADAQIKEILANYALDISIARYERLRYDWMPVAWAMAALPFWAIYFRRRRLERLAARLR